MPTYTLFSAADDSQISSSSGTYSLARSGTSLAVGTGTNAGFGQNEFFGYNCYEAFLDFDTSSITDTDTVTAVVLSLYGQASSLNTNFTMQARSFDFGTSVTTADWIAGASLTAQTLLASKTTVGYTLSGYNDLTSAGAAFNSAINLTGSTRMIMNSDRHAAGTAPASGTFETVNYWTSEQTGTTQDPQLVVTTTAGSSPINVQAVPANVSFSAPAVLASFAPQSPAALVTMSAPPAKVLAAASAPPASVLFSMPDDDFPGFEEGFDPGTSVAWVAQAVANVNFSALASLPGTAVVVTSPGSRVTFSAPALNVPMRLLAPPAASLFSALAKVTAAPQSPAANVNFAGAATINLPIVNVSPAALASYSALSKVLVSLTAPPASSSYQAQARAEFAARVTAPLASFSALTAAQITLTSPAGLTSYSGLASLAATLRSTAGLVQYSALISAGFAPSARGNANFSGLASLSEVAQARATVNFSALADYTMGGFQLAAPPASALFSALASVPQRVQAVPGAALFSAAASAQETLSGVGRADFQASARVTLTAAPLAAIASFTAPAAKLAAALLATPGSASFQAQATLSETLVTPAARADFAAFATLYQVLIAQSDSGLVTFSAPLIAIIKPGAVLEAIMTGKTVGVSRGALPRPGTGNVLAPTTGRARRDSL